MNHIKYGAESSVPDLIDLYNSEREDEMVERVQDNIDPLVFEEKKPWIDRLRNHIHTYIPLDETSPAIDAKVKGLKLVELAGHQARNAYAMIALENRQYVVAKKGDTTVIIRTKAGRIAEKYGSGKTFTILALILKNKCPRIAPEILYDSPISKNMSKQINDNLNMVSGIMRYNKKYLDTTIIFVSANVLNYWSNTILNHTNLSCSVIDTIVKLRQFEADVVKGTYAKDITLIKNGTSVTRGILGIPVQKNSKAVDKKDTVIKLDKHRLKLQNTLDFNTEDVPEIYPLITSVAMIMQKYGFIAKRLILDDFDTMKITNSVNLPTALFLWYVSSTNRQPKHTTRRDDEFTLKRELKYYRPLATDITQNELLNYTFRISCKPEYTDSCCAVGKPTYYLYIVKNPFAGVNNALVNLDIPNGKEIMEAFNSGSIEDGVKMASKCAGIDSSDPIDLLDKLLGDKRKIYLKCQSDIDYCAQLMQKLHKYPKTDDYPENELKELQKDIQSHKVRYSGKQIENTIKRRIETSNENMKIIKPIIERAKENLGGKNCQVCGDEFGKVDMVMMKCCNLVLCSTCGFHSSGIPKSRSLSGTCTKCRKAITIKDIIFISTTFNVESFLDDEKLRNMKEVRKEIKATEVKAQKKPKEELKTKEDIILRIVQGKFKKLTKKEISVRVDGLLIGTESLPKPEHDCRKIVIFSNHPEILRKVCARLTQENIKYIILEGTAKQRYDQVQEHKKNKTIPVIILNSMQACSGIDMPYLTDMIFCHDFIDKQTMGQASGRAQRMGRKYSMNYHYVFYDNEATNFTYTEVLPVVPDLVNPANPLVPINQANPANQVIEAHPPPRILTLQEIRRLPRADQLQARRDRLRMLRMQRQARLREMEDEEERREIVELDEDEEELEPRVVGVLQNGNEIVEFNELPEIVEEEPDPEFAEDN